MILGIALVIAMIGASAFVSYVTCATFYMAFNERNPLVFFVGIILIGITVAAMYSTYHVFMVYVASYFLGG